MLSAALDTGVALATVLIFLTLYLPKRYVYETLCAISILRVVHLQWFRDPIWLNWAGNSIGNNTADALALPYRQLRPGEWFGLKTVSSPFP